MADTFEIEIATPERLLAQEKAVRSQIPAKDGYIGVLPDHAPLVSELGIGALTFTTSGDHRFSLAVAGGFGVAAADTPTRAPCFFISQWQGWKAASANVIYLRVNMRDVYRVDLSAGSQQLMWPGSYHLITRVQGSSSICGPLDLQLALSDGHGFYQPLIATGLTKLTADEIAALPAKDRP